MRLYKTDHPKIYLFIYLFIKQRPKSHHRRVGAHQRQGKREEGNTRENSEEKERDRGTEGETPQPHHRQLMRS